MASTNTLKTSVAGMHSWPVKRRRFPVAPFNTPRATASIAAMPILGKTFCRKFSKEGLCQARQARDPASSPLSHPSCTTHAAVRAGSGVQRQGGPSAGVLLQFAHLGGGVRVIVRDFSPI